MISARGKDDQIMCVGSSLEELTQSVNEYLDPVLSNLHLALLDALANHPTLPLYQWLHQETNTFLMNAASASMNMGEYIANYFESVQEKLIYDLEKDTYKKSTERKKDLFYQLIHFYKTVMMFKADIGRRVLSVSDDSVTMDYIEKLNGQYEIAKKTYIEYQEIIKKIQYDIQTDLQYLTSDKFLNNFSKLLQRDFDSQLSFFSKKYQQNLEDFRGSKLDPAQLLFQVEEELRQLNNNANNDKIQRRGIDINHLVDESIISTILSQQFNKLDAEVEHYANFFEEKFQESCQPTFGKVFGLIREVRSDLMRQKSVLDILSTEDSVKFVDIEPSIESLRLSVFKQSQINFYSKWCSKNPGSILFSLEEIQRAAHFTYALSPVCNINTLQARREKIDIKLYMLDEKLQEIRFFSDEMDKFNNKTQLLKKEFTYKKNKLATSVKTKAIYLHKHALEKAQMQLDANRNHYIENLKSIARQCRQEIENKKQFNMLVQAPVSKSSFSIDKHHFTLPKSRKYLLPGILSGFSGVAIASLAAAVFTASTPVGLIVAASMTSTLLLAGTAVLLTKGYNRYKKNKLLRQHDEAIQENMFRNNNILKQKKFDSTTRHLMMKYNITIDNSANNKLSNRVKCMMAGVNYVHFFLDIESKKLKIASGDDSRVETVDAKNFQSQLSRFQSG